MAWVVWSLDTLVNVNVVMCDTVMYCSGRVCWRHEPDSLAAPTGHWSTRLSDEIRGLRWMP
jgi:hypothetical protein